ncbi:hypothetical protein GF420_06510 [candidate division GN15 bacterium]|nr:hypothetical protein [candidate division GN15 bacterium]
MSIVVRSLEELERYEREIDTSAKRAIDALRQAPERGVRLLERIKYERIGWHPIENRRLNLIEQVNQTFSYLTCFKAIRQLLSEFPESGGFRLHLGTDPGPDIESVEQNLVVAEVFAAVSITNNNKLYRDMERVAASEARHKYVFFSVPGFPPGRQPQLETNNGIQVWAIECHAKAEI